MLTEEQLALLTDDERAHYSSLEGEDRASFEYFMGFTHGTGETAAPITNSETEMYKKITDTIPLKTVCRLLDFIPHKGQQPLIYDFDTHKDHNGFVVAAGRRFGKSTILSIISVRELLVPFSSTVLVAPVFNNAKIIFNEVLKLVNKLELPIASINKGQFNFTLENGAKFTANSEANIEAVLGTSMSLILMEEAQSINTLDVIYKQMLAPTMLDYGVRDNGELYGRTFVIGTFRGTDNVLYEYFQREEDFPNWKSFTAPSMTNPTLPQSYFKQMRLELGEMLYNQEILAIPVGHDDNVFYAFDKERNVVDNVTFTKDSLFIVGIDIGWSDSTAGVWVLRENDTYYVVEAYSENNRATAEHIESYKEIEAPLGTIDSRYGDPAAAQTLNDYILTYDYDIQKANNAVADSIKYLNQLFTPTGANDRPKLYISSKLTELIRQVSRVKYKSNNSKSSKDPFIRDPKGTHWDLIAALRYAIYSDRFSMASLNIIRSNK